MTCLRSKAANDSFMVGTCNPDPDSWVLDVIKWYLDDDGFPIEEKCGVIRYFVVVNGEFVFGESEQYFIDNHPNSVYITNRADGSTIYIPPKTFTFINGKTLPS